MSERENSTGDERPTTTSPPDPTHEATTPPGNADVDQDALDKGRENLDQAGGGH